MFFTTLGWPEVDTLVVDYGISIFVLFQPIRAAAMHMRTVLVRECVSLWDQAAVIKSVAKGPRALAG